MTPYARPGAVSGEPREPFAAHGAPRPNQQARWVGGGIEGAAADDEGFGAEELSAAAFFEEGGAELGSATRMDEIGLGAGVEAVDGQGARKPAPRDLADFLAMIAQWTSAEALAREPIRVRRFMRARKWGRNDRTEVNPVRGTAGPGD